MELTDLTPWQLRNGRWYKREDLYAGDYGVNGSKFRALRYLMSQARDHGATSVVSGSSVHAPRAAMCALAARELDLPCTIIVGGTTVEKAQRHRVIQIAVECGARLQAIPVGYNPALQKASSDLADLTGGWQVPYTLGPASDASSDTLRSFLTINGMQVTGMPTEIQTLVIPFGSGSSAASILYGLTRWPRAPLERVVLVGIGPDRMKWLDERLAAAGVDGLRYLPKIDHTQLHDWFASYGDQMKETVDDIVMHPTYEGKVVRYLNLVDDPWWANRDGSTALWVVGGPF